MKIEIIGGNEALQKAVQAKLASKGFASETTAPAARKLPTVEELLASPGVSYWLKDALKSALNRDCVDASHDAELLAAVLGERTRKFLG